MRKKVIIDEEIVSRKINMKKKLKNCDPTKNLKIKKIDIARN